MTGEYVELDEKIAKELPIEILEKFRKEHQDKASIAEVEMNRRGHKWWRTKSQDGNKI